ncbi:MAG: hypothetical protein Kow00124_11850 [Anaerolineae bacterium]
MFPSEIMLAARAICTVSCGTGDDAAWSAGVTGEAPPPDPVSTVIGYALNKDGGRPKRLPAMTLIVLPAKVRRKTHGRRLENATASG